jgi:hypothetical protein
MSVTKSQVALITNTVALSVIHPLESLAWLRCLSFNLAQSFTIAAGWDDCTCTLPDRFKISPTTDTTTLGPLLNERYPRPSDYRSGEIAVPVLARFSSHYSFIPNARLVSTIEI